MPRTKSDKTAAALNVSHLRLRRAWRSSASRSEMFRPRPAEGAAPISPAMNCPTRFAVDSKDASSLRTMSSLLGAGEEVAQIGVLAHPLRHFGGTPVYPALRGADRNAQRRCYLLNRHLLHVTKNERDPLLRREVIEDLIA